MPERTARGIRQRFAASALNYRALHLLGPRLPRLARGWMPWVGLDRYDPGLLRGPNWVRLAPILSGVCGTDMALLTGHASAILSPFASFPAVLGHEVVARVTEVAPGAGEELLGRRVVVDPVLGCVVRGLEPCAECAAGSPGRCLRTAEGDLAPGPLIGFCRDLPGTWSDSMQAHVSQLRLVPDGWSDELAVLVEPFAVALHAVLAAPPASGERVLVIGAGSVGLCTLAALRLVAPDADVTILARHPHQARMAERLGADRVVSGGAGAQRAAIDVAGAVVYRPIVGRQVLTGGFEHVYDCVGTRRSLDDALRVTAPAGRLAIVGGPAEIDHLDWTLVWTRELRIDGTYVYGAEPGLPGAPHTFDAAIRLLDSHPELPIAELVTHRFGLEDWRAAMRTALDRGRAGALKVVFAPGV